MTPEQVLAELTEREEPSAAALRAAVAHAAHLAPHVVEALEGLAAGRCPYPHEANLIFFGIHVMAAARRREAWRPLLRALACPDPELEYTFGDTATQTLPAIALSLFDGDPEPLIAVIENRGVQSFVRWSLFNVLTRLTYDGVVARERTLAVIDRFDRERLAADHDVAWEGWIDAIVWLDLASHANQIRKAAREGRGADREIDIKAWEKLAGQLGTRTGPPPDFDGTKLRPIDDVVAALAWCLPEPEFADEHPHEDPPATDEQSAEADELSGAEEEDAVDPAADIALTDAEFHWFRTFLRSREVPRGTMTLAQLDGFLCALVVGPAEVPPETWAATIWGDGNADVFADEAKMRFVADLLNRHAESIVRRLDGLYGHEPVIRHAGSRTAIVEWAGGFMQGIEFAEKEWRPLLKGRRGAELMAPILFAVTGDASIYRDGSAPMDREEHLDHLTEALLTLYEYWRQPPELRAPQPFRAAPKPGRNQPCPCGSGKKYKRCCGSEVGAAGS